MCVLDCNLCGKPQSFRGRAEQFSWFGCVVAFGKLIGIKGSLLIANTQFVATGHNDFATANIAR